MPVVPADLAVSCRWIVPMTEPGAVLENYTIVVRDGRILDLVPTADALDGYDVAVTVDRSSDLVLPGLVNAYTRIAPAPGWEGRPECLRDAAALCIAEMLRSGTTCFAAVGPHPEESVRTAIEQGLRAVIGMPIAEDTLGGGASESLSRALRFRDEYRDHPGVSAAFAPDPAAVSDATWRRIGTLADELDAGIVVVLHESPAEIATSLARHGVRPLERLHSLGLLTPALAAVHMVHLTAAEIALAAAAGIAVISCPEASLASGNGAPPAAAWSAAGLRVGVGSGTTATAALDPRSAARLLAIPDAADIATGRFAALSLATRGGAAALGLEADIGTLEKGKWADLCCLDLRGAATLRQAARAPRDSSMPLHLAMGPAAVRDVWVAGRHLVNDGAYTRLDWPALASRVSAWAPTTRHWR